MNDAAPRPDPNEGVKAYLGALGERIRLLRARRGMSRKMLADAAHVSLRYLSDLENGSGNASILLLRQVAHALNIPVEEIVSESGERSSEFVLLLETLRALPEAQLQTARETLNRFLDPSANPLQRGRRIALIGLRGAGKTTLGQTLAARMQVPFVELNKEIERAAGMQVGEIHSLYGQAGYRRYERRCLEQVVAEQARVVLATPGSLVSNPGTYNYLLGHFFTIWLRASPEEHMARVVAQGDLRPIAGHAEAMSDLHRILEGRTPFYAKADVAIDTSGQSLEDSVAAIESALRHAKR